jgi:pseudaminic acid cytidylyltransferase
MRLAVIPARGGSKRIPKKNIRPFCGKPIIAYSIEAALASNCFDRIIVSTDCDETAEIARQYGAEVPFKRPEELSNDYCGTMEVIRHAVEFNERTSDKADYVACIYATAPLLTPQIIRVGLDLLVSSNKKFVFTASEFEYPIQRALKLTESGIAPAQPECLGMRSQDLPTMIHDLGQLYWGTSDAFKTENSLLSEASLPLMIERYRFVDIDTEADWYRAERLFQIYEKDIEWFLYNNLA